MCLQMIEPGIHVHIQIIQSWIDVNPQAIQSFLQLLKTKHLTMVGN